MSGNFTVGLVQTNSSDDLQANIEAASALIREAAQRGADFVLTPENTTHLTQGREAVLAGALPESSHPAIPAFADLARELGIWLQIGSLSVKLTPEKAANRSLLFNPEGTVVARYDKIHMFDVDIPDGQSYRESATFRPGEELVLADLPWGKLGMSICYDVRFPHLYRDVAKAGAQILTVPAAFTVPTGRAHWHTLLRARAIETGCFVLAPAQTGNHRVSQGPPRRTFGHSLAVTPWGEILADAGEEPGITLVDLDLAAVERARKAVPSLGHDRPYAPPRA